MNGNVVARIVVGTVLLGLMFCSVGCGSHWAKGEGSLLETHMYIGRAPMTHQWGVNNPLDKGKPGPADTVVRHVPIDPNPDVIVSSSSSKREARD